MITTLQPIVRCLLISNCAWRDSQLGSELPPCIPSFTSLILILPSVGLAVTADTCGSGITPLRCLSCQGSTNTKGCNLAPCTLLDKPSIWTGTNRTFIFIVTITLSQSLELRARVIIVSITIARLHKSLIYSHSQVKWGTVKGCETSPTSQENKKADSWGLTTKKELIFQVSMLRVVASTLLV